MEDQKTQDAIRRKARSESLLESQGLLINPGLPLIGIDDETAPRRPEEIAYRALCLLPIAGRGCGLEPDDEAAMVANHGLGAHFTPAERAYIKDPSTPDPVRVQFCWQFESAWVLLWALGYIEEGLSPPREVCDVHRAYEFAADRPGDRFLEDAKPVNFSEVLDQADLAYRMHWAVRQAWMTGADLPEDINPSIVYERNYALSWLIESDVNWDDVQADT